MFPNIVVVYRPVLMRMQAEDGTVLGESTDFNGMAHEVPSGALDMSQLAFAPEDSEQTAAALGRLGLTDKEIAGQMNMSRQQVAGFRRRLGKEWFVVPGQEEPDNGKVKLSVKRNKGHIVWNEDLQRSAKAMRKEGMSHSALARKIGCSRRTIADHLGPARKG